MIKLKQYIDISVDNIQKELIEGKIKPIKAPHSFKEIKDFIDVINKIILYLSKKNKTVQEFNSNVSHELKAPITELKTDLEYFLYYTSLDNNIKEKIKYFIKKIDNLETITSQMLFVSNNNVEKLNNAMQRVLLNDIIYEVIENKKNILDAKNISLEIDINQAISLHGHNELLKYAILNILDNAIKYSSSNQKIFIYLKSKKNNIYLIVKDNGLGIQRKDIKLIFHPYYRGENVSSSIEGYGLGLSLASWIFELHSAKIRIRSNYNNGTIVIVKFYLQ